MSSLVERDLERYMSMGRDGLRLAGACAAMGMLALAGCRSMVDTRPVAAGVAIVEIVAPVTVPANRARAIFQGGGPVAAADHYRPHCELEISTVSARDQQVSRDLFVVTRRSTAMLSDPDHRLPLHGPFVDITCGDRIYYEVEYRLASDRQPGVRSLRCRQAFNACWGGGGYPSLDAVRRALGAAFRIQGGIDAGAAAGVRPSARPSHRPRQGHGAVGSPSLYHSPVGHRRDEWRPGVRDWTCPKRGTIHDRDINAARNLEAEGLRVLEQTPAGTGEVRACAGQRACAVAVSARSPLRTGLRQQRR